MTLYQACQRINDSLEVTDNLVFNYLIWGTTDNGNFLRTQYCKRKATLQDKELGYVKYIVLGMQQEYSTNDFVFNQDNTNAKVQVFWCNSASKAKEVVEINSNLGYSYNITIEALNTMDISRANELINKLIDSMIEDEGGHAKPVIEHLLRIGFTQEELTGEFSFPASDVQDASEESEGEDKEE